MIFVLIILLIIWLVSMIKVKQLLIHNFRRLIILSIIIGFISFTLFEIDHLDISKNALYERTVTVFDNSDPSASMRKQMIEDGVEMWKEYPLLGIGLDQYRVISVYGTYSHNNYVELLVNLGLIGLLLYYSIHLFILFSCLKNAMKSFIKIWSFASIALILMWDMALVSYNLKIIWILIPWAIYIGMRPRTACFFA